nr:A disintegrin and metalloproteinase with thrombospondin motifs 16 isoform X1 [Onthophagus taurus]XP_022907294.1 A disintegrin and metalloproteinase with thrombospondin motifs 16 isoform X1 [Onthophagus taurus]
MATSTLFGHVLVLIVTWILTACAYDIHNHMTIEELKSTFHVDDHSLIPEYEVINISHLKQRNKRSLGSSQINSLENDEEKSNKSDSKKSKEKILSDDIDDDRTSLKLRAFGKDVHLNLVPNNGLFKKGLKLWTVEPNTTSQHGVEYVELPENLNENIGDIYQDEDNQAAILLRNDDRNGALLVEGSIGPNLVIRPLPTRLNDFYPQNHQNINKPSKKNSTIPLPIDVDDEMFLDTEDLKDEVAIDTGFPIRRKLLDEQQGQQHVVYKRKETVEEDAYSDYAFMEPDHIGKRYRRSATNEKSSRSKREAPYTIYPEILVIVDYDGYRLHGGDNLQIKRYFVSFWNGVDLRYKLLKGPKIRISIAGIIVSRGRDATPYLERNRVGRDAIDSAAALTDMGKYLFRERRLPVYDIAVAITKLDMCRRSYPSDSCNRGTAGFAYVGGACVINKRLEKVNSVAIIEDTGGFSGIIVAAHEVGHLLGAVHDGSPPPSYLGGPGAQKCQWEDGYIMSDLRHTERGFRWSPCSVASFHHFLNGDTASCLFNSPHEDDSLPRVLPGKLLTLDAQCRRDRGTSACFKDERVCAQLFCFDAGSGYCVAYRPAAEGSPCGDGQYCLNGRCVAEHENIIPDFSQNTPSYVRQDGSPGTPGRTLNRSQEDETSFENAPPSLNFQYQYQQNPISPSISTTTTSPPSSFKYSPFSIFNFSTTRSPYDFQRFSSISSSSSRPPPSLITPSNIISASSTLNPYIGNYYLFKQRTTKSPYDFANFGKVSQPTGDGGNLNRNHLKRSYDATSYSSSSDLEGSKIKKDALVSE